MEKGLKNLTQAYRTRQRNQNLNESPAKPAVKPATSHSDLNAMPPPRTVDAPTASLAQQDLERPLAKRFEDRHLRHFDRPNSTAARVPDAPKERLKHTISTDGTVNFAARHKSLFMALGRTTRARGPGCLPL